MALKDLEPSQPDSSKFTQPRTEYMDLKETSTDNTKTQSAGQAADYAPLHPLTRSWEVAMDHVTIEKVIGKGAFGQVAKGTAVELRGRPGTTTVAIKMLKCRALFCLDESIPSIVCTDYFWSGCAGLRMQPSMPIIKRVTLLKTALKSLTVLRCTLVCYDNSSLQPLL